MTPRIVVLTALAVLATSGMAAAAETRAEIPFANSGGIDDWRAESDRVIYVKGRDRQWFKAELLTDCLGLKFAEKIGFKTEASGAFNRFSSILVDGKSCPLSSFEKSDPPAKKDKDKDKDKDKEAAKP